jgi:hypothetical protein
MTVCSIWILFHDWLPLAVNPSSTTAERGQRRVCAPIPNIILPHADQPFWGRRCGYWGGTSTDRFEKTYCRVINRRHTASDAAIRSQKRQAV